MTVEAAALKESIENNIAEVYDNIEALYRHLHQYPELPFQEHKTSARLADELEALGFEVTRNVGRTGVVAMLRNGDGPTVMLRGDMDALPIEEQTGLEFASREHAHSDSGASVPVMHACGHDLHSSCLVGAGAVLMALREQWRGTLMLICQPAEEIFGGARAMLEDGLYQRFARPDIILGQHNMPALAGTVGHIPGRAMAAATTLGVTVHGVGGHGSTPSNTVDPVVIAAHIVTRLQTIVSREVPPDQTAVVTVGKLHAGTQGNVIPNRAELEINVRSFDNELHGKILDAIRRIVSAECLAGRSPRDPEFKVLSETITLDNDVAATEAVHAAHAAYFGEDKVFRMPRLNGSEDFPYFGNAREAGFEGEDIPYVYWYVGQVDPRRWEELPGNGPGEKMAHLEMPHSPHYAPGRKAAFETGIATLAVGALSYLEPRA